MIERKVRLDGTHVDFECERLLLEPGRRAVLRYVVDRAWPIAGTGLVVPPGAVTIAHYWMDRPYNVYRWSGAGAVLGYYCNVAEPIEIGPGQVSYIDLVVDVLIEPDGTATVLDEEEVPADLAPARRAIVARALEALTSAPKRLVREIEAESRPFL